LKHLLIKHRRNLAIIGFTVTLISGAFAYGFHRGSLNQAEKYADERIQLQEDLIDLGERLSLRNAELLAAQTERQELIDDLEAQALSANGSDNPGVATTGGLQRLCDRWGARC
jgi:hypothetical protein